MGNLESAISLTPDGFLWTVGGSQYTRWEPTQTRGRMCKLHTETKPRIFLLRGDSANRWTTVTRTTRSAAIPSAPTVRLDGYCKEYFQSKKRKILSDDLMMWRNKKSVNVRPRDDTWADKAIVKKKRW